MNRPTSLMVKRSACIILLLAGMLGAMLAGPADELKAACSGLPFAMPEMKEPVFPDRVVSIADHGAVGDGQTLNTNAFAEAIAACSDAGGGTVTVPPGTWLTGPIALKNNINLRLERGALVQFSRRFEDYPLINGLDGKSSKFILAPPISGYKLKNIAITGPGMIDGGGEAWRPVKKEKLTARQWKELTSAGGVVTTDGKMWWPSQEAAQGEDLLKNLEKQKGTREEYAKAKEYLRPNLVSLMRCNGILIDGPTFRNSPKFHVYPQQCENLIVRNVSISSWWYAQNGDGLDLGSCRNAVIYNCTIDVGDDALCLKPQKPDPAWEAGAACRNIVVRDCIIYHGHGGFVIGSESYGGVENVSVKNCIFSGTDVGLRFKSVRGRGGDVKNVFIEGIRMRDIANEAILFDLYYNEGAPEDRAKNEGDKKTTQPVDDRTPSFHDFTISDVVCDGATRAILINGLPEMPVKNISISKSFFTTDKGAMIVDADGITLRNVSITPAGGPVVAVSQSKNCTFDSVKYPAGTAQFLTVSGEKCEKILLKSVALPSGDGMISIDSNVKPGTVIK
jgi:polygalacturonase